MKPIEIKKYKKGNEEFFKITEELLPFIQEACYNFSCMQKHKINQEIKFSIDYNNYLEKIIKQYNDENFKDRFNKILKD